MSPVSLDGRVLRRGDDGYEELRRRGHNARKPDRFPEVIVRPESEEEVVAAVRLARAEGLKVKARSGGHSWTASSVRDGMLVDLEALDEITVDPVSRTATVQPGVKGEDLGAALRAHGLFFPGGHCPTVCVGGYLLQGGFGWNGRLHGPGLRQRARGRRRDRRRRGRPCRRDDEPRDPLGGARLGQRLLRDRDAASSSTSTSARRRSSGAHTCTRSTSWTRCSGSRWRWRKGSPRRSSSRCSARRRGSPREGSRTAAPR